MGIFFDLTSLRDPRVLAGPLSTRILLGDVCPPCTWLYSLLFVDINCSYLMVLAITIGNICPYYFMTFALLLGDICEHCWIFKYVACRRPSEFHQSKRVVPRCGQILVFGLSHAASQPRSRSGQRTQSFHQSYYSMFNVQYSLINVQCSMFCVQCSTLNVQFWRSDQHTQSIHQITHTVPYLIIVIFSPRTNSPEKYAITQFLHHSLIKIRFSPCRQH